MQTARDELVRAVRADAWTRAAGHCRRCARAWRDIRNADSLEGVQGALFELIEHADHGLFLNMKRRLLALFFPGTTP